MRISNCKMIPVQKITDPRGDIGVIEGERQIPFAINRIYYSYNTPQGIARGGHAHKKLQQLMIAMAGSFDIMIDDGNAQKTYTLSQPCQGLYICPMIWRELTNFSPDAICMVLASEYYDEDDYFRDYKQFLEAKKALAIP
ncbi:MAG: FdtA/QdtA family cupin domain-containing protein [Bdellovibrionales bacterium]